MRREIKKIVATVLSVTMSVSGIYFVAGQTKKVEGAEWNLVWSDEFNGTELDKSVWSYDIGNGDWGWGNGEVEYYTDRKENVDVADGYLQIKAIRENYKGFKYTSGRIKTKDKKAFLYGKMEARLKVENGNQDGVWPAYWMMGNNISNVGWPRCGEIDIMEHANSSNRVGGCLHWGINGSTNHGSYGSGEPGKDYIFKDNVNNGINGWHTYGLIWDAYHMEWQVDGVTYFQQDITKSNAYCFQKEQFFLFNLALGGPQTGFTSNKTPNESTYKTATMYVDWLRVYTSDDIQMPTTKPVETIDPDAETKVTYETVDSVADSKNVFGSYFGGANGWGTATGSISNATNTGVNIHADSLGDNLWQIQASLSELDYIAGNTYTYKCTIKSDVTKSVRVKVVGDGDGYIFSEDDITVQAGVPYNYEKKVTIPADYEGRLDLYFGLGKNHFVNENIDSNTSVNINISNMSFVTEKKVITVIPPVTEAPQTTVNETPMATTVALSNPVKKPARVKFAKITAKKKSIKLKLKKIKKAYGYQIRYSINKKFKKSKTKIKNTRKLNYTIKKLKSKKKYFIKVRAYVLDSRNNKVYGKFSKIKKIKTK